MIQISFIVIGKNEGYFLIKCFESIIEITKKYQSIDFELIYVDSDSTDNSINEASKFNVKTISLKGECNAAIARNIGANESKGEFLIFLDGDMEIQENFIDIIINSDGKINYSYVTGDILNLYYDSSFNFVNEGYFYKTKLQEDTYLPYTGGFFCIKRELWFIINGMKEKYRRSQDLDFGLRLSKRGIYILRKKELAIKHNTISYFEKKRMIKIISNNDFGYRAMLYRDHIFNKNIYKMLFRADYSLLFLIFCLFICIFFKSYLILLLYIVLISIRAFFQSKSDKNNFILKLFLFLCRDFQMILSFFFFFPKEKKAFTYKLIKK
jgi:glycosyltransferase involved in cell wall biosynthesis